MLVNVICKCGKRFQVESEKAGKNVLCPACTRLRAAGRTPSPAYDVFISHSSRDKIISEAVCQTLEARQLRCWIAPRNILGGMDWGEAIVGGIENSRVMVLIVSANSSNSDQVAREVQLAASKHLTILPVRIDNAPLSRSLQYFLGASQWLEATTPPLGKHLERLAGTIRVLMAEQHHGQGQPLVRSPLAQEVSSTPWQEAPSPATRLLQKPEILIVCAGVLLAMLVVGAGLLMYRVSWYSRPSGQAESLQVSPEPSHMQPGGAPQNNSNADTAATYIARAAAHYAKRDYDRAIVDLDQAVRLDPRSEVAYLNRAMIYYRKKDYAKTITDCTKVLEMNPQSDTARQLQEQAMAGTQGDQEPPVSSGQEDYAKGVTCLRDGDLACAITHLTTAIEQDPQSINAHANRGIAYHRAGKYKDAITDFTEVQRLAPQLVAGYNFRGQAYLLSRQYDKAITDFSEAIKREPDSPALYQLRGRAYAGKSLYVQAISDYSECIRRHPQDAETYYYRSLAYTKTGRHQQASTDRDKALSLDADIVKKVTDENKAK